MLQFLSCQKVVGVYYWKAECVRRHVLIVGAWESIIISSKWIMEANSGEEATLDVKVLARVDKAFSSLSGQIGKRFDECLEKLLPKIQKRGTHTEDVEFWSVEEIEVKPVVSNVARKPTQKRKHIENKEMSLKERGHDGPQPKKRRSTQLELEQEKTIKAKKETAGEKGRRINGSFV
ncbi:hypothetical protein NDU88_006179 [Pleurodeles waltl]|uniref:Uncharacterized protein n=1 Tax=Pleurodeles waltl TaxID=8319 RepID=A0AAV7LR77_PLEWA|nr:hypothetical protein NDU88_006179 [Pleurodeles waltl]